MAHHSSYSDENFQKSIAKKKKLVNELLALRRMKYMQKVKEQRKSDGALDLTLTSISASKTQQLRTDHAKELLGGTLLESEAFEMDGENGQRDVVNYFAKNSPSFELDEHQGNKKNLFLHNLLQNRKDKLEEKQQDFYDRDKLLRNKKVEILEDYEKLKERAVKLEVSKIEKSIPDYEDKDMLSNLVNVTKNNMLALERNVEKLKLQQKKKYPSKLIIPQSINYTFQPWQSKQVAICTEIVEEIVQQTLNYCFGPSGDLEASLIEALLQSDNEQWEKMMAKGSKQDGILFVIHELITEVTDVMIIEISEKYVYLKEMIKVMGVDLVINSSELVSGKAPRKSKEQKGKLIDQTWAEITGRRLTSRKDIWSNSQPIIAPTIPKEKEASRTPAKTRNKVSVPLPVEVPENEGDIEHLTYEHIVPKGSIADDSMESALMKYSSDEYKYWEELVPNVMPNQIKLSYNKVIGISFVAPSFNHEYIALGTYRGDVLVFSTQWRPFRPIRCVAFNGKPHEYIRYIAWSLDASRILTLGALGNIFVWSVTYTSATTLSDAKVLGFPNDKSMKHDCQQLTALVALIEAKQDYAFSQGPLALTITETSKPSFAKFSSEMSAACSQNVILIGFENGNIIRCNVTDKIQQRYTDLLHLSSHETKNIFVNGTDLMTNENKIGQNIKSELFRSHKFPIRDIYFLLQNKTMISIDKSLNICIWEISKDYFSGFNWFTPVKKMKIKDTEETIVPKGPVNVIFEDIYALKIAKGKKSKGKNVIEKERREVLQELKVLKIKERIPWDRDDKSSDDEKVSKRKSGKYVTKTYAPLPEEIVDNVSEQTFHILTKHKDKNIVVKYATQTYVPGSHKAKLFLDSKLSFDGRKVFFMFLYDEFKPNIKKHITWIDLNLDSFDMSQSTVIKFNISEGQFDSIILNPQHAVFDMSKIFRTTGSDYIFANIAGALHAISVVSGTNVMETAEFKNYKEPNGLKLSSKLGKFNPRSKVYILCPNGLNFFAMISPIPTSHNSACESGILNFTDESIDVHRQALQKSFNTLNSPLLIPSSSNLVNTDLVEGEIDFNPEQTSVRVEYTLRDLPVPVYVQLMLYSIVDNAVAIGCGTRMGKEQRTTIWKKDWTRMQQKWQNSFTKENKC